MIWGIRFRERITLLLISFFLGIIIYFFIIAPRKNTKDGIQNSQVITDVSLALSVTLESQARKSTKCVEKFTSLQADIKMFDVYNELPFDNVHGGVWTQGWNIRVNYSRWNRENVLRVFVVPHSHNDPGWKETFEGYYMTKTRHIFDNMVEQMSNDPRMKFIWAEISFLSLWWDDKGTTELMKRKFKTLIEKGQLEIVTGGWVMTDEANSHYYSMIQQLSHGHRWLKKHLNMTPPRYSWCIDPFGVSPTMPLLLNNLGFKGLVIQRTHYSVKKYLAKQRQLEFRWRQSWDVDGKRELFTHMMPFFSYDIPHTCGPDPKICCQFDFERMYKFQYRCPWKVGPQIITPKNIASRARLLLDQYRKKAELFSTNVLLVPLGDDFRYTSKSEWLHMFENYQYLFDFMNSEPSFYVRIQFGTLKDYFEAVSQYKGVSVFPSLEGDFFTYADRNDHYWSGYFTTRPYYKTVDRELISHLRSAEILRMISWRRLDLSLAKKFLQQTSELDEQIEEARATLSLFQHHDGITGTSKPKVVADYNFKLTNAILGMQNVVQRSVYYILRKNISEKDDEYSRDGVYFNNLNFLRNSEINENGGRMLYIVKGFRPKRIVVFNPLSKTRVEILKLHVNKYINMKLVDSRKNLIRYQINPNCGHEIEKLCYTIYFEVRLRPFEIASYFLTSDTDVDNTANMAKVTLFNPPHDIAEFLDGYPEFLKSKKIASPSDFSLDGANITVGFRENGLLKSIFDKKIGKTTPLHLDFIEYTCKQGREMCGAYLFLPENRATIRECVGSFAAIYEGHLMSSVVTHCDPIIHTVNVPKASYDFGENAGVELRNEIYMRNNNNREIAMRISTGIKNDAIFYTDLNGFQMAKRKYADKIPLQGNYYPMPSAIYIEDRNQRLTLVSGQPLGAASLSEGQIEVMQDRRLMQDDNLGLGEGITDNRPTSHVFHLLLETRNRKDLCANCEENDKLRRRSRSVGDESDGLRRKSRSLGDENEGLRRRSRSVGDESEGSRGRSQSVGDESEGSHGRSRSLGDENEELHGRLRSVGDENDGLHRRSRSLGDENEGLRRRSRSLGDENDGLRGRSPSLGNENEGWRGRSPSLGDENEGFRRRSLSLGDENEGFRRRSLSLGDENEGFRRRSPSLGDENEGWRRRSPSPSDENDGLRRKSRSLGDENERLSRRSPSLGDENEGFRRRSRSLGDENEGLRRRSRSLGDENEGLHRRSRSLGDENEGLRRRSRSVDVENKVQNRKLHVKVEEHEGLYKHSLKRLPAESVNNDKFYAKPNAEDKKNEGTYTKSCADEGQVKDGLLSAVAHFARNAILYPSYALLFELEDENLDVVEDTFYYPPFEGIPKDVQIVSMATLLSGPVPAGGVVLHRTLFDKGFASYGSVLSGGGDGCTPVNAFCASARYNKIYNSSFSFVEIGNLIKNSCVELSPMELRAFYMPAEET